MSWDTWVDMIRHTFSVKKGEWTCMNVCEHGAIYGKDGGKWGTSKGFEVCVYPFDQAQDDGSTK